MSYTQAYDTVKSTEIARNGTPSDLVVTYPGGKLHFHQSLVGFYSPTLLAEWLHESKTDTNTYIMDNLHTMMYGGDQTTSVTADVWMLLMFGYKYKIDILIDVLYKQITKLCQLSPALTEEYIALARTHKLSNLLTNLVMVKVARIREIETSEKKTCCKMPTCDHSVNSKKRRRVLAEEVATMPQSVLINLLSNKLFT